MIFLELDEDEVLRLLEGYTDELTPETIKEDAFYRQFTCPRCRSGALHKNLQSNHCFGGGALIARSVLTCENCGHCFDPHTGLALNIGNTDRIYGVPILKTEELACTSCQSNYIWQKGR